MSVDWYPCNNCGETFPDCGEYVYCEECGTKWCSDECAEEDGYIDEHCSKYDVYGYSELDECREENECDKDYCSDDCEHYVVSSCKYCREEDFEDDVLLEHALFLLKMTRQELIESKKLESE